MLEGDQSRRQAPPGLNRSAAVILCVPTSHACNPGPFCKLCRTSVAGSTPEAQDLSGHHSGVANPELGPAVPGSQARRKLGEAPLGQAARQNARLGLESRENEENVPPALASGTQPRAALRTAAPPLSCPFCLAPFYFSCCLRLGKRGGLNVKGLFISRPVTDRR